LAFLIFEEIILYHQTFLILQKVDIYLFQILFIHGQLTQFHLLVSLHGMLPELLMRENSSLESDALEKGAD
jgi:hypothetical protein